MKGRENRKGDEKGKVVRFRKTRTKRGSVRMHVMEDLEPTTQNTNVEVT